MDFKAHLFPDELLKTENEHIQKLHDIVREALDEEELIVENLLHPPADTMTRGQHISDRVAEFGGSWGFIISFGAVLLIWITFNVVAATRLVFDPYPFILLNLVLSTIAALQAPVIMMSQNRKEEKDRKRAENDYLVNLKAEIEVRNLHRKINLLMEEQFGKLMEVQAVQLQMLEDMKRKYEKKYEL